MSAKETYDKKIFAIGIIILIIGIGLGAFVFLTIKGAYPKVNATMPDKKIMLTVVEDAKKAVATATADHTIPTLKSGADEQHTFDLFAAPTLWLREGSTTPIDVYEGEPIHPPVPNKWFIENGLAQEISMSNVLSMDSDGDGYTNQEEFEAQTNPKDADSHPSLIDKVEVTKVTSRTIRLAFTSDDDGYGFQSLAPNDNPIWKDTAKKLSDSFGKAPDEKRFRLVKINKQPATGDEAEDTVIATVEDQRPTKEEAQYTIKKGKKNAFSIKDSTAKMVVTAGTESGKEFDAEQGATFKIPGDTKITFILVSIEGQTVTVKEKASGKEHTLTVK